ncbi:MAG: nuclear transport factor 2 family protein [Pseudomonadota bacterium]
MQSTPEALPAPPFDDALTELRAALADVACGDTAAIKALYAHSDDATSFYGWGGYERGWTEVEQRWNWAGQQFKGGTVHHENLTKVVTAELAYTTDIETFEVQMDGMDWPTRWSNRVTHIFRLQDGRWRLLHRHANRLEDQYRPSTRLKPVD